MGFSEGAVCGQVEGVQVGWHGGGFCLLLCDPSKLLTSLSHRFASNLKRGLRHLLLGTVGEGSERDEARCQVLFRVLPCHWPPSSEEEAGRR